MQASSITIADLMSLLAFAVIGMLLLSPPEKPSVSHVVTSFSPEMRLIALSETKGAAMFNSVTKQWVTNSIESDGRLFITCGETRDCISLATRAIGHVSYPFEYARVILSLPSINKSRSRQLVFESCFKQGRCQLTVQHDGEHVQIRDAR